MHRIPITVIPIAAVLLACAAMTQSRNENWARCTGPNPDIGIDGCTAVIQSGHETPTDLARAFDWRGYALVKKGQYDRAIDDFDQAIKIDPNNASAFSNRGAAYEIKDQYDHAIENYDQAIKLNPNLAIAWNNRCGIRAAIGQLQQALADCNEALRLRPANAGTLDNRGFTYLKLKQLDSAIADYDAALVVAPKLARALYGRGLAKRMKGVAAGADVDIAAAKELDPDIVSKFERYRNLAD